jgi:hypothetical protein
MTIKLRDYQQKVIDAMRKMPAHTFWEIDPISGASIVYDPTNHKSLSNDLILNPNHRLLSFADIRERIPATIARSEQQYADSLKNMILTDPGSGKSNTIIIDSLPEWLNIRPVASSSKPGSEKIQPIPSKKTIMAELIYQLYGSKR